MKIILSSVLAIILCASGLASEGSEHHSPGPLSLIPAAVNFIIFFGILFTILRKPILEFFIEKAERIDEAVERAKKRVDDAKTRMEAASKTLYNVDADAGQITDFANKEAERFEADHRKEMKERSEHLRTETKLKMEFEREALFRAIHKELVNEVVLRASDHISKDTHRRKRVSDKLLEKL